VATQLFGTDPAVLLPRQTDTAEEANFAELEQGGNAIRGFFFVMLFNLFLFLTVVAVWVFWRLIR
jgi:hypothetical protein